MVPLLLLFSSRITICHSTLVLSKEEKWGGDQCAPTSLFFEGGALNQDALVFPPSLLCPPARCASDILSMGRKYNNRLGSGGGEEEEGGPLNSPSGGRKEGGGRG